MTGEYIQYQTLNYLPYGEDWVEIHNTTSFDTTRLGFYRFNGKEKDYESGFHYYGARYYWSELLTGWLSVDPMADKYPSISPYAYCMWNPVKLVDPDGQEISTHIDKNGNVLAVYNDGNLGIYMHSNSEIQAFRNGERLINDYTNLVGATLHENSFVAGDKIDLNSNDAKDWMTMFESWVSNSCFGSKLEILRYCPFAINGMAFDPKSYMRNGSQLSLGTYISPRDLGNYAAGRMGKMLGFSKTEILGMYGAFQLAGNNPLKLLRSFNTYYNQALNYPKTKDGQRTFGEAPISNYFQRLGYEGINSIDEHMHKYSKIWED